MAEVGSNAAAWIVKCQDLSSIVFLIRIRADQAPRRIHTANQAVDTAMVFFRTAQWCRVVRASRRIG
jgi:hypothetical protein